MGFNAGDYAGDGNRREPTPVFGDDDSAPPRTSSYLDDAANAMNRVLAAEAAGQRRKAEGEALQRRNAEEEIAERAERAADREAARADREQAATDREKAAVEARKTTKRFWVTAVLSGLGLLISGTSLWWAIATSNKPPTPVVVPTPTVVIVPPPPVAPVPSQPTVEPPR